MSKNVLKKFGLMGFALAAATLFHPAAASAQQCVRDSGYYAQGYSYNAYPQPYYRDRDHDRDRDRREFQREQWAREQSRREWEYAHRAYYPPPRPPVYYAPPRAGVFFSFGR